MLREKNPCCDVCGYTVKKKKVKKKKAKQWALIDCRIWNWRKNRELNLEKKSHGGSYDASFKNIYQLDKKIMLENLPKVRVVKFRELTINT